MGSQAEVQENEKLLRQLKGWQHPEDSICLGDTNQTWSSLMIHFAFLLKKAQKVWEYLGIKKSSSRLPKRNSTVTAAAYPGLPPINIFIISENAGKMIEGN